MLMQRDCSTEKPMNPHGILTIDAGTGTQDILLWEASQPMENNVKRKLSLWAMIDQ